tara:strand:+ start:682 stop:1158 length:477 start_codon:yes stop_codon:yes gene_type:complete
MSYNTYREERIALENAYKNKMCEKYGVVEVTTDRQAKNGTMEFEFPVSCFSKQMIEYNGAHRLPKDNLRLATFKNGYVRKQNGAWSPYQINKTYKQNKQWTYVRDGELYTSKWVSQARELIGNQMARLIYMFEYAIRNYGLKPTQQIITINGIKYKRI